MLIKSGYSAYMNNTNILRSSAENKYINPERNDSMKKSRQIISLLLSVLMITALFTAVPFTANAAETGDSDVGATYSGTTGDCNWSLDTASGLMKITGSGEMGDLSKRDDQPWAAYRDNIKTVLIGDSVTCISNFSFEDCSNLESVTIGKSVSSIDFCAFDGCDLSALTVPDSVTYIGSYAFYANYSLKNVTLGKNLEEIGDDAFEYDAIEKIVIPDSVVSIGEYAFYGCGIKSVTLGRNVERIKDGAFMNCDFKDVMIPKSVTKIGEKAFGYRRVGGVSDDLPIEGFTVYGKSGSKAETYAGENGFVFIDSIIKYDLWLGNTQVTEENAADIFGDGKASYDNSTKTLTLDNPVIPGKATDAYGYTAKIYSRMDELTIEGSYLMTASEAKYAVDAKQVIFDGNFSLYGSESGVYAYGIKFNGGRAYCWGKTGQGVQTTGVLGVYDGIQRVEFTSKFSSAVYYGKEFYKGYEVNVTTPANYSYGTHCILDGDNGNADATTVVLDNPANGPKSGTTGDCTWEFDPGTGIMTISGSGEMANYDWNDSTESTNVPWWDIHNEIKSVVIGDGVTFVGNSAFQECNNLTSLTLGKSVKEIAYCAFYFCNLSELVLPDSVEEIGNSAFCGNSNLKTVSFGKSLKTIGSSAFLFCDLSELVLPDGVRIIFNNAFADNKNLKKATIPASVIAIYGKPFGYKDDSTKVEGFTIYGQPDTAAQEYAEENGFTFVPMSGTTGDCTWNYDADTKTITISGNGAMADYSALYPRPPWYYLSEEFENVIIEDGVTNIGDYTFAPATVVWGNIKNVKIGSSVKYIGQSAFPNTPYLESITIPDSVEEIRAHAFNMCTSLWNIKFGKGIKRIEWHAFTGTKVAALDNLPDSMEYIGSHAFYNCHSLSSVILGSNIKAIGNRAFESCDLLKEVTIPQNVTEIDEYAFGYKSVNYKDIPVDSFTIKGYDGTEAERYANANEHITFVSLGSARKIGDVDGNGSINISDVTAIQRHIAELDVLTGDALIAADTNGDGVVDITDATHLQKYLAEYDVVLGKQ